MLLLAKVEREFDFTVIWQKGGREGKKEGRRQRGRVEGEKKREGRQAVLRRTPVQDCLKGN